jgi:hypothetical protein
MGVEVWECVIVNPCADVWVHVDVA